MRIGRAKNAHDALRELHRQTLRAFNDQTSGHSFTERKVLAELLDDLEGSIESASTSFGKSGAAA